MEYGAIDLHKKDSQIRIVTEDGEVLDRRIATTRDRFTAVFEGRRPMRILLEAWTARAASAADASKPIAAMSPRWPRRVSGCRSWCGAGAAAARS
jgi:hypothetical protein